MAGSSPGHEAEAEAHPGAPPAVLGQETHVFWQVTGMHVAWQVTGMCVAWQVALPARQLQEGLSQQVSKNKDSFREQRTGFYSIQSLCA